MRSSASPWRRPPLCRLVGAVAGALAGIATAVAFTDPFGLGLRPDVFLPWFAAGAAPVAIVLWARLDLDRGRRRIEHARSRSAAFAVSGMGAPSGPMLSRSTPAARDRSRGAAVDGGVMPSRT